ncbi:hypothetical protein HYU20_00530 [Candidatus Woesearchaeota archaeon]|nr:hypothetical protein [Candidatus Woesearchaeota archaeon]
MKMFNGRKGALSGKKVIGIIFLVVGLMLLMFIISQAVNIVKVNRDSSNRGGFSSVHCVGFLYTVKGITATGDELQFEFRNEQSSTEEVHNLTVIGADKKKQAFQISVPVGSSMAVRVPVMVEDNFSVYPDNCEVFPARCSVEGICAYR